MYTILFVFFVTGQPGQSASSQQIGKFKSLSECQQIAGQLIHDEKYDLGPGHISYAHYRATCVYLGGSAG